MTTRGRNQRWMKVGAGTLQTPNGTGRKKSGIRQLPKLLHPVPKEVGRASEPTQAENRGYGGETCPISRLQRCGSSRSEDSRREPVRRILLLRRVVAPTFGAAHS